MTCWEELTTNNASDRFADDECIDLATVTVAPLLVLGAFLAIRMAARMIMLGRLSVE